MKTEDLLYDIEADWPPDQAELCEALRDLVEEIVRNPGTSLNAVSRPGISHSLRARVSPVRAGRDRPLYMLLDVITPRVGPWSLSVCFYEDEIMDPLEYGQPVPQGLYGETGYCFDLETFDKNLVDYLNERIKEAYQVATGTTNIQNFD
ncbi:MAG: hypothetical protein JRI34_00135 [Deltaproteobacteria bacterium]|nr:hypothetical protein [Deltaproteobacteria bacterium]